MTTEHDPLDPAGQERTFAANAQEERLTREKELNDLRWVMGSKQGRRFMWRLLSGAGLFRSSFSVDSAVMAFNEGFRNAGLQQLNDIMEACPDRYTEMLTEHKAEKEKNEHRNADPRNKRS